MVPVLYECLSRAFYAYDLLAPSTCLSSVPLILPDRLCPAGAGVWESPCLRTYTSCLTEVCAYRVFQQRRVRRHGDPAAQLVHRLHEPRRRLAAGAGALARGRQGYPYSVLFEGLREMVR